ncbi:MAG: hypothetical protein MHPSP_003422, partial [Paramarteilia canceri]
KIIVNRTKFSEECRNSPQLETSEHPGSEIDFFLKVKHLSTAENFNRNLKSATIEDIRVQLDCQLVDDSNNVFLYS